MFVVRVLFMAVLALSGAALAGNDLESVLEKYARARGGVESLRKLHSFQTEGSVTVEATTIPFKLFVKDGKSRLDLEMGGMVVVQVYDGAQGWQVNPTSGRLAPQPLSGPDLELLVAFTDLSGPLIDWKKKGNVLKYLGLEEVEGKTSHGIFVQVRDGFPRVFYLDAETYLPIAFLENTPRGMVRHNVDQYAVVGGITFVTHISVGSEQACAHSVHTDENACAFHRRMVMKSLVLNPEIEDRLFEKEDVAMLFFEAH